MMIPPFCLWCKHFKERPFMKEHKMVCEAFPDNIPKEIWVNEFIHQKPYEGDNGIMLERWQSFDELPELLKLIVETSTMPFDELLDWLINYLKESKQRK